MLPSLTIAAGQTGMGTVMCAKKLKSIAIRGSRLLDIADRGGSSARLLYYPIIKKL
jgi:aldehyde:ferredoxin oxidoreductase